MNGVKQTGRKKLVMAGLWTEVYLLMLTLGHGRGYVVYFLTERVGRREP